MALQPHSPLSRPARVSFLTLAAAAVMAACGGGGGGGDEPPVSTAATVTAVQVAANPQYSRTTDITITGTNLGEGIAVGSAGCKTLVVHPTLTPANPATTRYYQCTVSGLGDQQVAVTRNADGSTLGTAAFNVPMPQVTMTVSNGAAVSGDIVVTLAPDKAPITSDNFLNYVNSGFYDGLIFHRVLAGFVIQGGGYYPLSNTTPPQEKPTNAPIALEVGKGLSNVRWTIAMARTTELNSATSQFFINLANNVVLDTAVGGYAVFGSVTAGTNVVTAIVGAPCGPYPGLTNSPECSPNPNVVITSARQTR